MLDNHYRIVRYLASGGFGNTYEAVDTRLGCRVAVKEFFLSEHSTRRADGCHVTVSSPSGRALFEHYLEKFKTEARRISQLRNNHIVRVSDLFDANGTAYYVMDFIDGESLKYRVRNGQTLAPEEAVKISCQVLDALEVIHRAGLYHLDVKPANIMLTNDGDAVLIDFGASKQIDNAGGVTQHSMMVFSPGYAPSEQLYGKADRVGPWTDFYALGATLYAMLSGKIPPSPSDITDDGEEAFCFSPAWPDNLKQAVLKMMAPSTKKRPQNVTQMRTLLLHKPLEPHRETSGDTTILPTSHPQPQKQGLSQETQIQSNSNRSFTVKGVTPLEHHRGTNGDTTILPTFPIHPQKQELSQETQIQSNSNRSFTVKGVTFKMIFVKGGTFMMGATYEQGSDAESDEKPAHKVTLSDYCIGETEVTQALWKAVMGSNPSRFQGDGRPVERVSWDDSQTFIRKLNAATEGQRLEGREFRLPTEAEWEFAARGGNLSIIPDTKYSGVNNLVYVAWYGDNSNGETHPVAKKSPNELGLYDMSGNVWEWCQDWYDENYYGKSPKNNPCNNTESSFRVDRGGCWGSRAAYCRVSGRNSFSPGFKDFSIGLRLAL